MAKKTTKKKTAKASAPRKAPARSTGGASGGGGAGGKTASAAGKRLVIVESPAKAKTINKYLGSGYIVKASVGHIRDLPAKNPKGDKSPVPGVDLENRFEPTYTILEGKSKTVTELKQAAKSADEVWFATDLDREGEAIAWHLAHLLGIDPSSAKRVVFNAITKAEIQRAFDHPHAIDQGKVDAQQARRILDRIVGYQVSPLLWKKVARGLSAGRVQSVAVRLIVEREREIRAFIPDETWRMTARFALDKVAAGSLAGEWAKFLARKDEKGNAPTLKLQNEWMASKSSIRGELVEVGGAKFDLSLEAASVIGSADDLTREGIETRLKKSAKAFDSAARHDLTPRVRDIAQLAGMKGVQAHIEEDEDGKGPARFIRTVTGAVDPATPYRIKSLETKRTTSRPSPPFITSTLQQAASTRLGFGAQRTMRTAQRLYEGIELPGEGAVGLITYMRTDSTHLSGDAIDMARKYIASELGDAYLPDAPNFYTSSNKDAQEAHEAIRPTSLAHHPDRVRSALTDDQYKLYRLIWERFVSCQMTPAQWDSTTVLIEGGANPATPLTFRATGRVLVFDGFYRVSGVPSASDEQTLPAVREGQPAFPFSIEPEQRFSSPPPRYTEAALIKVLESEGIGRPSTYASIIQVIQDRKYVEQNQRRFMATDLGEVVTNKLIEAFPDIMELGYTREMEAELDRIETDHHDWRDVLEEFYTPFRKRLHEAESSLVHAKAEVQPAPYTCEKCGAATVYRFGKNGRFLSCSRYPKCDYAAPVDRDGKPRRAEYVNVRCPKTGRPMIRRTGRFGPFITTELADGEDPSVGIILNIDKTGKIKAPSQPALETELPCSKCGSPLALRDGVRGPWLGCSAFPKCRGRGKWAELDEATKQALGDALEAHKAAHPIPLIRTLDGRPLTDENGRPLKDAPTIDQLVIDDPANAGREVA